MCGFAGFYDPGGLGTDARAVVERMRDRLAHRGPDDVGTFLEPDAGVAFGHRRLSVVDLSSAGAQPMASPSGRYVIAFNGEMYNHLALRDELGGDGIAWRGHSDTEVLLAAVDRWGVRGALERAVGMFAFALFDVRQRVLTLARDRMGEKPCYYGWQSGTFVFGSELKALRAHPRFEAELDHDVVALYLRYGYVPAPYAIYRGIRKVPPGTVVQLDVGARQVDQPVPDPYWSIRDVVERGIAEPFAGSEDDAVCELERYLAAAVRGQRVADVPLGAFLSGGIDSSTIVAIMQSQADRPVRTFTIGFDEAGYDESAHARAVATHLGTEHTELRVTPREAMDVIPSLPELYDEPFGDASAVPTVLVSRLARRHVTVSLSGDGGDELFGGYWRYLRSRAVWDHVQRVPSVVRALGARSLGLLPLRPLRRTLAPILGGQPAQRLVLRARALRNALAAHDVMQYYRGQISLWQDPARVLVDGALEPPSVLTTDTRLLGDREPIERMMYLDTLSYLPDDILVKVDRAAMSVSLETRVPLLDHRLVAFAWTLPPSMKVRDGQGKWLLRQVLARHVPTRLIDRPKMGFAVPVGQWVRGPLRDWAEDLLDSSRVRTDGVFRPEVIADLWRDHVTGVSDWRYQLWAVLVLQAWLRQE